MNVDIFKNDPSIKYYFIAAICMMLLVFMLWYCVKQTLSRQDQTRQRRGFYARLYRDLSEEHPRLWSRRGPREGGFLLLGRANAVKWRLLISWFAPAKLDVRGGGSVDQEAKEPGIWTRLRVALARRWLDDISREPPVPETDILELPNV
jgi:hypothetical protein